MDNYFITFRSITGAQKAVKILGNAGISVYMMRTPKAMATEGCGYALRIREDKIRAAVTFLKSNGLQYGRVLVSAPANTYREVFL